MKITNRLTPWIASCLFILATTAHAQRFNFEMVTVPASDAQPGGPAYDYEVAVTEVTNAQYVAFLNNAEFHNEEQNPGFGNERGANLKFRQPPFAAVGGPKRSGALLRRGGKICEVQPQPPLETATLGAACPGDGFA